MNRADKIEQFVEMSDTLFRTYPVMHPLFDRYHQFESHESWQWLIDGCPDGQYRIIPGLMDHISLKLGNESRVWYAL